jgi:hypothetical protein
LSTKGQIYYLTQWFLCHFNPILNNSPGGQPAAGGAEAVRHVPDLRPPRAVPRLPQVFQDVLAELCRGLQGGHGVRELQRVRGRLRYWKGTAKLILNYILISRRDSSLRLSTSAFFHMNKIYQDP